MVDEISILYLAEKCILFASALLNESISFSTYLFNASMLPYLGTSFLARTIILAISNICSYLNQLLKPVKLSSPISNLMRELLNFFKMLYRIY